MPSFDDLRELYTKWRLKHRQYQIASADFVYTLCSGFGRYIGAPDNYIDVDKSTQWYVGPLRTVEDETGNITFLEPNHRIDALVRDSDGFWVTAISLRIDTAINAFAKDDFL